MRILAFVCHSYTFWLNREATTSFFIAETRAFFFVFYRKSFEVWFVINEEKSQAKTFDA